MIEVPKGILSSSHCYYTISSNVNGVFIMKNLVQITVLMGIMTGCSCGPSVYTNEIQAVQKGDKQLSCKDIVLEMNEAEFHKNTALDRKKGRIEDFILPYCYPAGYVNANNAQKAAQARIDYLNQVYELMDCSAKTKFESRKLSPPPTVYKDLPPPPVK